SASSLRVGSQGRSAFIDSFIHRFTHSSTPCYWGDNPGSLEMSFLINRIPLDPSFFTYPSVTTSETQNRSFPTAFFFPPPFSCGSGSVDGVLPKKGFLYARPASLSGRIRGGGRAIRGICRPAAKVTAELRNYTSPSA